MVRHPWSPLVTQALAGLVVGCALLVLPTVARAQAAPPGGGALGQGFGDKGQLVISGEDFFGFDKVNHAGWRLTLKPAVDYFIMPAVTIGGFAALIKSNGDASEYQAGARAGFNLNVNEMIGVWPKVGIGYDYSKVGTGRSNSTTLITAYLPVMFHIVPHLFFGIGPYYNLKIAGDGDNAYGFTSMVGGWF